MQSFATAASDFTCNFATSSPSCKTAHCDKNLTPHPTPKKQEGEGGSVRFPAVASGKNFALIFVADAEPHL